MCSISACAESPPFCYRPDAEPRSDALRTALNVFRDLELAHTRQTDEDPSPTTQTADRRPSGTQQHQIPTGGMTAIA